jgi:hypothetical protein
VRKNGQVPHTLIFHHHGFIIAASTCSVVASRLRTDTGTVHSVWIERYHTFFAESSVLGNASRMPERERRAGALKVAATFRTTRNSYSSITAADSLIKI